MLTFEPAKLQGENWRSGGLTSSGGPGGSSPSGGIKGGLTAPFNKKGHILELKKALKINFSIFSAAVRSLVAPTVYKVLELCVCKGEQSHQA